MERKPSPKKRPFQSLEELYQSLIKKWMDSENPYQEELRSEESIQANLLKSAKQVFCDEVVFDQKLADLIIQELQSSETARVHSSPQIREKADHLTKFGKIVRDIKYISKPKFQKIKFLSSPPNSIQSKIKKIFQEVKEIKKVKQNIKSNDLSYELSQIWKKYFNFDFNRFWVEIVPLRKLFKLPQLPQFYELFQPLLKIKFRVKEFEEIKKKAFIPSLKSEQILEMIAHERALGFHKRQLIEADLEKLKSFITEQMNLESELKFQTYGSFRSGFSLSQSDIDLIIFCKNNHKNQRQFITQFLLDLSAKFNRRSIKTEEFLPEKGKIQKLKVYLKSKGIRVVDIVVNNKNGLEASLFLQKYSSDTQIKNLIILVKAWAKKSNLGIEKKFHSYGVGYMMFYYLMKKRKLLSFIEEEEENKKKKKIRKDNKFSKEINLYEQFMGFLEYFSKGEEFFKNKSIVCLVKYCSNHEQLNKSEYLINIHDLFDDQNNLGRLNASQSKLFFESVERTKRKLKEGKIEGMHEVFGLIY